MQGLSWAVRLLPMRWMLRQESLTQQQQQPGGAVRRVVVCAPLQTDATITGVARTTMTTMKTMHMHTSTRGCRGRKWARWLLACFYPSSSTSTTGTDPSRAANSVEHQTNRACVPQLARNSYILTEFADVDVDDSSGVDATQ